MNAAAAWRVAAAEGPRAAAARAWDRLAEVRRRRSFAPLDGLEAALGLPPAAFPILILSGAAPAARLGGVQAALLARLAEEERRRPLALLYPRRGALRLELTEGPRRRAAELAADAPPAAAALDDAELERVVAWAVERCGARALHVEGAAGLPLGSLARLAGEGLPLILALHDFALFCPRPHLFELPAGRFCNGCREPARCAACLAAAGIGVLEAPDEADPGGLQDRRRELGAALLARAAATVFPSDYLRRAHAELFPTAGAALAARSTVIPPARPPGRRLSGQPPQPGRSGAGTPWPRRVALVGGAQPHKGGEIFAAVAERLAASGIAFTVYGGGDADLLRRLRRLAGVGVRGYYRSGALPRLLRRDRIDLALLLSVVPESYSLALSECRLAGVPVLAFDHGAVADRIRAEGGGLLIDPAAGAAGVAERLEALLRGTSPPPGTAAADLAADDAGRVADRWLALYAGLGLA